MVWSGVFPADRTLPMVVGKRRLEGVLELQSEISRSSDALRLGRSAVLRRTGRSARWRNGLRQGSEINPGRLWPSRRDRARGRKGSLRL